MRVLPWLPSAPASFKESVRSLRDQARLGEAIQALASHELSDTSAFVLSRAIHRLRGEGVSLAPLTKFRLGVLPSSTFNLVADVLPAAAARHGVDLELVVAPYGQVAQEAMNPTSTINSARCDAVLLAIDHRWLRLDRTQLSDDSAAARVRESFDLLRTVVAGLQAAGTIAIIPILATEPASMFGHLDRRVRGTPRAMIDAMNQRILDLARETGSYVLDVASLAERVGTANWFCPTQWNLHKLPFAPEFNALFADAIGRVLGAIRGKARKCLVLDLDNTLWCGVVGDDGVEGLKIGEGSPEGEAHLAVQRLALELRDRGIILAVSSKNNDDQARKPFREHPDMLIKESDIAVFQANWVDKATNLEAIAKSLNIGIDALVLLDDNSAERAQVRATLPMVAVPELPADVSLFASYLASAGYFEAVSFSNEDILRAQSYAADARRAEVMTVARDVGNYLAALEMVITHASFDAIGRQRISQLINKSNQFNLTTRRYTESDVAAVQGDPRCFSLQSRLRDRFGELGMISVVICREASFEQNPAWEFDTWLMSCRVLGRKVEEAVLLQVSQAAGCAGVTHLLGRYCPTSKNEMVKDHYEKLGFSLVETDATGSTLWVLDLRSYVKPTIPMKVEIIGSMAETV